MEKNVAKHVLADVLWVTHKARGARETRAMYELLIRSYRSRQMDWHEECLQMAWEQYKQWLRPGNRLKLPSEQQCSSLTLKKNQNLPYPIRLEKRGRGEWEFAWPSIILTLMNKFDIGCEQLEAGYLNKARRTFNNILMKCPYFIDVLNHLAIIDWDSSNLAGAEKHYTKAYEIGLSVLPTNFQGKLPWGWVDNRPFLRTLHGLALIKLRQGNTTDTKKLLEWLIKLEPYDQMGARAILEDIKKSH